MPKTTPPSASDLSVTKGARFLCLPQPLTKVAVRALFEKVTEESNGRAITREIRVRCGSGAEAYVYSFLCFCMTSSVPFLTASALRETRYGFVLLIERRGHLAVFHRGAKGLDDVVAKRSRPVDRRRLTHLYSGNARYQKLTTRRMSIAKQELRGASYEADDLELALVPATAGRSILQSIRMATEKHGNVGVTPSTGRVRMSASRVTMSDLVAFVDETIDGFETIVASPFLSAFPEPIELQELPNDVVPVGLLIDLGALYDLLDDPLRPYTIRADGDLPPTEELLRALSAVLEVREAGENWDVVDETDRLLARMKRRKADFGIRFDFNENYLLVDSDADTEIFSNWLRRNGAFSISFSSPEYFYTRGKLYRIAGFRQEVAQVRRCLSVLPALDDATSEKGGPYSTRAKAFDGESIFGVVESTVGTDETHLWCCDLGDEWADYIGVRTDRLSFYHCKHGDPTTGASAFQIVVGQALKNLARIKFRFSEVRNKIERAKERQHWSDTKVPLLARSTGSWSELLRDLEAVLANPNATWRVSIVVTALSMQQFDVAAAAASPAPYFVQLVWLFSAFISMCREHDAQAVVYCRS